MTVYRPQPPWEFLLNASRNTLKSYELSRLTHAANVRKEIVCLLDQWLEENAYAMLAHWLIEQRELSSHEPKNPAPEPAPSVTSVTTDAARTAPLSVSDNFLADRFVPPHVSRSRG